MRSDLYERLLRPLLFRVDAEWAHRSSVALCRAIGELALGRAAVRSAHGAESPRLRTQVAGLELPNPLGLAAGYDKNGHTVGLMAALGFGHVEIGSVSRYRSIGNRKPRLFRLPRDRALVVHYGLPNDGARAVAQRLRGRRFTVPVGLNLVKTNDPARPSSDEETIADYVGAAEELSDCAQYLCLNLSCPNTEHGRNFFDSMKRVDALLGELGRLDELPPVFLKMRPYEDRGQIDELVAVAEGHPSIAGFALNLPPAKPTNLATPRHVWERLPGAVSGKPVEQLINESLAHLHRRLGPDSRYALLAAGGVFTAEDAYRKIRLGASLVQMLTGLVYRGPGVVREVLLGLERCLDRDGLGTVSEAVGGMHC